MLDIEALLSINLWKQYHVSVKNICFQDIAILQYTGKLVHTKI